MGAKAGRRGGKSYNIRTVGKGWWRKYLDKRKRKAAKKRAIKEQLIGGFDMSDSKPPVDLEKKVREQHWANGEDHRDLWCNYCENDQSAPWPCGAIQLADKVERLREALEVIANNEDQVYDGEYRYHKGRAAGLREAGAVARAAIRGGKDANRY